MKKLTISNVNDDFAEILERWEKLPWVVPSWTWGNVYDPEKYELTPRKDYLEKEIKQLEATIAYHEGKIKELTEDRKRLLERRDMKSG